MEKTDFANIDEDMNTRLENGKKLFEEYCNDIKNNNRFFPNEKFLRIFDRIINYPLNTSIKRKGLKLYRARRNKPNKEFELISDLSINKSTLAVNRASPTGIFYMYLAQNADTAIAEIRPDVSSYVTVAEFETVKKLKFFTLDIEASHSVLGEDEFTATEICLFLQLLSQEFANPINKNPEINYLPCQFFAEYCKKKGFDGLRYVSSAVGFHKVKKRNPCYNYVLFDEQSVKYINAEKYLIEGIEYSYLKDQTPVILK